ncbi:MAG: aldose 1-epimerase family protein [Sphingomonadaceae bacterium]
MAERIVIRSDALVAEIAPVGAELQSLTTAQGHELMSSGDPAFWTGRAPLLFPIVGRLNEDALRLGDRVFSLEKHGFARRALFDVIATTENAATFRLTDDAASRAHYPFAFALDAAFALEGATLTMDVTVTNTGDDVLPFSVGYHPAFAWPLPFGGERADHVVVFASDEPASLCQLDKDGMIVSAPRATPVVGNTLALGDHLFEADALIWKTLASRRLRYGPPAGPALDISFPDTDWLGIWTKPGAAFLCIEPWAGSADDADYSGDFRDKPGVLALAPGTSRAFRMNVSLVG